MSEEQIVIFDGSRPLTGSFVGKPKGVTDHELGVTAAQRAPTRTSADGVDISEVVMGCTGHVGPDAYNAPAALLRRV